MTSTAPAPGGDVKLQPGVTRFITCAVALPAAALAYADAVLRLAAVRDWMDAARRETQFVRADEPCAQR